MSRVFILALFALALSACGEQKALKDDPAYHLYQLGAVALGLDLVSLINTGKTLDDQFIGAATDQDCSVVRASKGGAYCEPLPQPIAMVSLTSYCYRSLGGRSTCYTEPIPGDAVGFNGSRTDLIPAP